MAPGDRARLLRRFADAVDGDIEQLAQLEVTNSGHTISNARWEAGNVRDVIAYYSGAPERLIGQQIPVADGLDITFHEPLGVVGTIVPWNFPMPIASWSLAPALAAGNTVVVKPAELTPLTAMRLAELALEAGIPEDVFQVLPGPGGWSASVWWTHPDVAKIVFTGSTEVGKRIMAGCAEQREAGHPRARGQERQRRIRRRRYRGAAAASAPTRCSTTPGRTAAPGRGSSSSAAPTTASCRHSKRRSRRSSSPTPQISGPRWAR